MPSRRRRGKCKTSLSEKENFASATSPVIRKRKSRDMCEDEEVPSTLPSSPTIRSPSELSPTSHSSLTPMQNMPLLRQSGRQKLPRAALPSKVPPSGVLRESTPLSPVTCNKRDSLYGFEDLDSPLTFSPIVSNSPYRLSRSKRSHTPGSAVDAPATSTALKRRLSDIYYQPIPTSRARKRPRRPKQKPDQVCVCIRGCMAGTKMSGIEVVPDPFLGVVKGLVPETINGCPNIEGCKPSCSHQALSWLITTSLLS